MPRELRNAPINQLLLDQENPRLPIAFREADQDAIAIYIERQYDALSVARSIAEHGYFESEPLIALDATDGKYVVVEGNRRLTAVRGLLEPDLRARFTHRAEWDRLARQAQVPPELSIVVAGNRLEVAPIIGYRHISGILQWDPHAQARYVAQLVDERGLDFVAVQQVLGESSTSVRSLYRNFAIISQADQLGYYVGAALDGFGVFTRAMQSPAIRAFVGAPGPAQVTAAAAPIPHDRTPRLQELLVWLFGDERSNGQVIGDSRHITRLARVLESETGIETLRQTEDLGAAEEAIGGTRARLLGRLAAARQALESARQDIGAYPGDEDVEALLVAVEDVLSQLRRLQSPDTAMAETR